MLILKNIEFAFVKLIGLYLGQKLFSLQEKINEKDGSNGEIIDNYNGNYVEKTFTWKTMLSVIASLPPKQLQKLDSIISTVGEGGSGEILGWDSFCGYSDVKITLKKLLRASTDKIEIKIKGLDGIDDNNEEKQGVHVIPDSSILAAQAQTLSQPHTSVHNKLPSMTLRESMQMTSDKVRGIVLYGPSGCGKSYLARIIASEVIQLTS